MAKLIGVTGTSWFQRDVFRVVEENLQSDWAFLNHSNRSNLAQWVCRCDGIILPGGQDIHPSMYGQDVTNFSGFGGFDQERDELEKFVLDLAFHNEIPVLGICRGLQFLGVYHNMTLIQDIGNSHVTHNTRNAKIETTQAHRIFIRKGTKLNEVLGGQAYVNSFHHQAIVDWPAPEGIVVEATAQIDEDTYITEAMSGPGFYAVQWHPEYARNEKTSAAVFEIFSAMMA